ncbi:cell division transporter [Klebsiella pneumoniae]|uniref:Cell division transporter n=1 Tax=Klebsiella pneumoniae TaxID=573 RepID=A0A377U1E9_KLEPN|nr:cell division transporter [Klebsiella pneumoniae]
MIRFEQVSKAYLGGRQALQGVTFHLQPGEMAFLTRPFRRREEYPAEALSVVSNGPAPGKSSSAVMKSAV